MQNLQDSLTLAQRLQAPTPKFFRVLRRIGVIVGAAGAAIMAAPVALPAAVVAIGGYLVTAGTVIAAVSSTTVDFQQLKKHQNDE